MNKKIEDLNVKELIEDLEYYVDYANIQCPSFVDNTFNIIREYIKWLKKRFNISDYSEEEDYRRILEEHGIE